GFLDFAKPVPLTFLPTRLDTVLKDLVDLVAEQARKHSVKIVVDTPASVPVVSGDAAQLKQAFLNLVLNGLHAMADGGTLTLKTEVAPGRVVRATVSDTGPGIAEADLPRVFDLFWTTKPEGSGLGLPTVQRIVDSHGGKISVESRPGATTFTLTFPMA